MPDHLRALVSFPQKEAMSSVIADWKRFHSRKNGIVWQDGYFDHRLRDDERGEQFAAKIDYIRRNPVVAKLCVRPEDWPWVYHRSG
jgi:putative transposase